MERRIMQIFERKKAIIDQAKHQADLFDQHLASQLLVSGIYPPNWLWTPLFQSQNFDCAGGLPQCPEFAIPSDNSLENKTSEAEYNAEHVEFPVQSEILEARSSASLPLPASGPGCSLHGPNLDSTPIHLQDKEDDISDNVQDPAMSLARLQRSKSRQRAIELRNSAKSASRLQDEKSGSVFDGRISGTTITSLRSNHVHEVEVVKPSDTKDSQERNGVKEWDHIEEGPVTRPRLSCRKNSSLDVNASSYISDKDEKAHADDTGKLRQQTTHASGKLELFSSCSGPIGTDSAIIPNQKKETQSRRIKERRTDSYRGRITRSMSYRQNYHNADSLSMPYSSFNTVGDDGSRVRPASCNSSFPQLPSWSAENADSNISQVTQLPGTSSACHKSAELQNRNGCALLVVGNLVDGCAAGSVGPLEHAGEQSGVKSLLATEDIVEPVKSSSIMGHGVIECDSSCFRKIMPIQLLNKFQEGIQKHKSVNGPSQAENIAGTEIGTYGSLNPPCAPSTSNLDSAGLSDKDVNTSSYISDKDEKAHADDTGKLRQQSTHASGKLELFSSCSGPIGTDPALIPKQKKETQSRRIKERRTDSYRGRITRSMSYRQNYHNADSHSMSYSSFNTVGDDGSRVRPTSCNSSFPQLPSWSVENADSNISQVTQLPGTSSACHKRAELQNRNGCALLVVGNLVDGCAAGSVGPLEHAGEQSGVKSLLATEDIVEPVKSSSIMGHGVIECDSSCFRKIMPIQLLNKFQEGIQKHKSVNGPSQAENIAGTEIGTYGSLNPPCAPSTSNLDSTGLVFGREVILSRMSSDCSVSGLSQHNEFDDNVVADSNKICSLLPRDEIDNISSDALDFTRSVRGQNICNSASDMALLKKQDIFTIEGKLEGASMLIEKSPEISALQPNLSRDLIIDSPAAALEVEKIVILEQQKMKSGVPEMQAADTQSELADESVEAATEGSNSSFSTQQHMQKKIDDQLMNPVSVTATPDVEKDLQFITRDFIDGKNEEDYMNSVHFLPSSKAHVTIVNDFNSCSEGMDTNKGYTIEGSESSPELQVEKDEAIIEVQDSVITSITDLSISPSFGLVTNSGGVCDCLEAKEGVTNPICRVFDAGKQHVIQENQESLQINEGLSLGDSEHLTCVGSIQGKTYHLEGKRQFPNSSVGPLHTQSSDDNYVDETMAIFERFLVQSDDKRVVKEEIDFEKGSWCVYTPLSSLNNYVQSVSGGILERMDVASSDSINEAVKLLKESKIYNENAIISSSGSSYSDRPLNSNNQFASNVRNYYVSPVGKLWNRITSDSIISEKSGSLNSELPCIREENENGDGVTDTLSAAISEDQATISIQRVPLANINEMALPTVLVSEAEICDGQYNQYSVDIDNSISGLKKKHCNERNSRVTCYSNIKENHSAALGGNGAKGRFTGTKLLGDTGLNKESKICSEKETKPSNVVSNITSFIPLVQKKQVAAAVKGKRDIKVKALDAAEAAKRLAEKKENDRKMKKEAMKLERERMEQENLKQLEMQRKKKEEEQKKKEDDMAAKKRQREKEDKKEKERKRLRTEEMRKRQREYNEKSIAEKGMGRQPKDRKARSEKEWKNDIKIVENDQQIDSLKEMSEAEGRTDAASTIDTGKSNTIHVDCRPLQENCNEIKGLSDIDHSTKSLDFDTNQHSSYEISPFKCSDDEEEEDDDMPNSKFIPSWASKSSLARAVASQSTINPETIFPLKSFCNIVEVVLPRKSQLK